MIISRETLVSESNKTGFRPEILEKVIRLMDLLNEFSNHDFLKSRIALKGGTGLNLFYFDLPRLSVDIDLNYVGSHDREIMLAERPEILSTIEDLFSRKNYQTMRQPSEHAGGKWSVSYKSELVQSARLEVDLNFIARVPLWPISILDSIKIGSYQAKSVAVLDYYDLMGGKLCALFARHKSRDLFDTYAFFKDTKKIDVKKLKLALIIYGAAARIDLRKITLEHLNFDPNDLKNMLIPVLRKTEIQESSEIRAWASQLINSCKVSLAEVINFNASELEFLGRIIEQGDLVPELLTDDQNLIDLIKLNPAIQWKCLNIKQHKAK